MRNDRPRWDDMTAQITPDAANALASVVQERGGLISLAVILRRIRIRPVPGRSKADLILIRKRI